MGKPHAYVLGPHDARRWVMAYRDGGASSELPFGAEQLRSCGFRTTYSSVYSGPGGRWLARLGALLQRRWGRPVLEPMLALIQAGRPELFISFFEENAPALAFWMRWPALRPRVTVVVICWLSAHLATATDSQRRAHARALRPFDLVVVFSTNQRLELERHLGLPPERIAFVPFGVEPEPFAAVQRRGNGVALSRSGEAPTRPWALAVGSDKGRDFATLAEAVGLSGLECRLAAPPHLLENLHLPPLLVPLGLVSFRQYLDLLHGAAFVVVPSHPLAYPTGQTALLEAMASGKACITTATVAMQDYVQDGCTALLVPPHDADALAEAMGRLAGDEPLCRRLGEAARKFVLECCTTQRMWSGIAAGADAALARKG